MDVAQSYEYLAAKGQAIKAADKEDSYNTGLRQFLDEKGYKPTFEPFKLGTMLTDQRPGSGRSSDWADARFGAERARSAPAHRHKRRPSRSQAFAATMQVGSRLE